MKKFLPVLWLLMAGCNSRSGRNDNEMAFEQILASKSGTFWLLQPRRKGNVNFGYRFFANGQCYPCVLTKEGKIERFFPVDAKPINSWRKQGDTLVIERGKSKILHFSQDSISLYFLRTKALATLRRSSTP